MQLTYLNSVIWAKLFFGCIQTGRNNQTSGLKNILRLKSSLIASWQLALSQADVPTGLCVCVRACARKCVWVEMITPKKLVHNLYIFCHFSFGLVFTLQQLVE